MSNDYDDPNISAEDTTVDPNANEPVSEKRNGGKRAGAGRPRGSKNQFSKHSVDRLKELNFDPMEKMVDLYFETEQIIDEMEDTDHPRRYSAPALAALVINKQKIVNDLLRYGYRYVPEKIETEVTDRKPFQINLTGVTIEDANIVEVIPAVDSEDADTQH